MIRGQKCCHSRVDPLGRHRIAPILDTRDATLTRAHVDVELPVEGRSAGDALRRVIRDACPVSGRVLGSIARPQRHQLRLHSPDQLLDLRVAVRRPASDARPLGRSVKRGGSKRVGLVEFLQRIIAQLRARTEGHRRWRDDRAVFVDQVSLIVHHRDARERHALQHLGDRRVACRDRPGTAGAVVIKACPVLDREQDIVRRREHTVIAIPQCFYRRSTGGFWCGHAIIPTTPDRAIRSHGAVEPHGGVVP